MIALVVNGRPRRVDASPDSPLPRVIPEERRGDGREHLLELPAARDHPDHAMHAHRDYPMMRINEMSRLERRTPWTRGRRWAGPEEPAVPRRRTATRSSR
jgi:hypothetical protein